MKDEVDLQVAQAQRVIERLERLSADSYWAHRASGVRGALLRSVEKYESEGGRDSYGSINDMTMGILLWDGYNILEQAAKARQRNIKYSGEVILDRVRRDRDETLPNRQRGDIVHSNLIGGHRGRSDGTKP